MGFNRQGAKDFAPETAVGTGAAEPLVDEYEAAKAAESVDESTVGDGAQNKPGAAATIEYSGEPTREPTTGDDEVSTGEDWETRNKDNDDVPLAGAGVDDQDTEDVNKKASEVAPEVPQAVKRNRRAPKADNV